MSHYLLRTFALSVALILGVAADRLAADPRFWQHEWPATDFTKYSVDLAEIMSGGPGKDGIPAISDPQFIEGAQSDLPGLEPVLTLAIEGARARAYPLRYLMWHEIVNDRIDGQPVTVTFCPLCNTAMVFDGRHAGGELTFGVTGKLRYSDMVMYDHQSQSWWQQAQGMGIVGEKTGVQLEILPSWLQSVDQFRAEFPDGLMMAEPNYRRAYGRNPYVGYDSLPQPFLYAGEAPPHGVPSLAHVVKVGTRAWPLMRLAQAGRLTEAGVTLSWRAGQASALDDGQIAKGRDIGSVRVRDAQGRDLPHEVMFAFAFHAFNPEGEWMMGAR